MNATPAGRILEALTAEILLRQQLLNAGGCSSVSFIVLLSDQGQPKKVITRTEGTTTMERSRH